MSETAPTPTPAAPDAAAASDPERVLMIRPSAMVEDIERDFAVVRIPETGARMRMSRPVYEIFRVFRLPTRVSDILPADELRRGRVLAVLAQVESKGFLVPESVGIPDFG